MTNLDVNVYVFPNPATSYINVRILNKSNKSRLHIFDATGKVVGEYKLLTGINKIPLVGLSAGVYYAALEGDSEKIKFIKK